MRPNAARRAAAVLVPALAFSASAALVPAAPAVAQPAEGCTVQSASITWGFKESFRAYLSGSIAHGSWAVSDGAAYQTPSFGFSGGTGSYEPYTGTGEIAFTGTIRFTGHEGLLDTTVANPTIVFGGADSATLHIDLTNLTMDEALAGEQETAVSERLAFVAIDLSAASLSVQDGVLLLAAAEAPTAITAGGYEAFGTYQAGESFDPFTFEAVGVCAASVGDQVRSSPEPSPTASASPDVEAQDGVLPGWFGAAAVAALVALGAIGMSVLRRRRSARDGDGREGDGDDRRDGDAGDRRHQGDTGSEP